MASLFKKRERKSFKTSLPKFLYRYQNADFAIQQRAKFLFYLSLLIIGLLFLIIPITAFIQINYYPSKAINIPMMTTQFCGILSFSFCIYILISGKYTLASNLLLIFTFIIIWLVLFQNSSELLIQTDTIAYAYAILSASAFIISKNKILIVWFTLINILLMIGFIYYKQSIYEFSNGVVLDFILDNGFSMAFIGIVGYNFSLIHDKTLQRALDEITERNAIEKELDENEEKFRIAFENAPTGMSIITPTGKYLAVNPLLCEMFGYSQEELLSNSISIVTHPDDIARSYEWIQKKIANEPCEPEIEKRFIHKNGSIVWAVVRSKWIRSPEGAPLMAITHIQDITEQKLAHQILKENEEQYRVLFESANDSISVIDESLQYIQCNEKTLEIFGCKIEDIIGNSPIFFSPEYQYDSMLSTDKASQKVEIALQGKPQRFEWQHKKIDGTLIDTEVNLSKFEIQGKTSLLAIVRDITKRKKIELELENHRNHLELLVKERTDELSAMNEELMNQREELQQTISQLALMQNQLVHSEKMASLGIISAGIAHEINNPLNFIQGGAWGISQYFNEEAPQELKKVEPLLHAINEGVFRATEIVKSLGHYSRQDEESITKCEIHSILNNSIIMLQNNLKNKVEIIKNYSNEDCIVMANETKLQQVFVNIISNAEHAIENKGTITITTILEKETVLITFEDTGCGISKEIISKIFDPFFTTKPPGKGSGLGLSISYNIIQEHKGSISIDSKIDSGTKVIILLPKYKS